ncbi:unnamed protein product [Orchesella dallaii]|uniref:Uncharacterized protein n=1 Tax=Orchesella dallaii TaxID=48710 RepID=A0ABP1R9K9_9HEXA
MLYKIIATNTSSGFAWLDFQQPPPAPSSSAKIDKEERGNIIIRSSSRYSFTKTNSFPTS